MTTPEPREDHELAACPFCGAPGCLAVPAVSMIADCDDVCVECSNCEARSTPVLIYHARADEADRWPEQEAEAIAAWNRRPSPVAESTPADDLVEAIARFVEQWNGSTPDGNTFLIADGIREHFAALSTPTDATAVEDHPAIVTAIGGYGGRCRDCADMGDGVCENRGLPCGERKYDAIRHVLRALAYYRENPHFLDQIEPRTPKES